MKYIIWGAGEKGKRIFFHLNEEDVEAFIDTDENKVGKYYCGKKVISFEEYKKTYFDCYIIISFLCESKGIELLEENNIYKYFLLTDCPGEFQEAYPRDILKEYIQNYLKQGKKYIIYGCTLYSLILSRWIEERLGIYVNIIPHLGADAKLSEAIKIEMPNYKFDKIENLKTEDIDEILITVESDMRVVNQLKSRKTVITNVYDCTDNIEEYYNPEIEKLKNIHKEERCFIVATGPSLRIEDLNILRENREICISMNSIWRAFQSTEWRPQYYIAVDYTFLHDYGDIMEDQNISYLFLGDTSKDYWSKKHKKNHLKHHFAYECYEKKHPKFSSDFSRKSYQGFSVTYNAIQLAVYMGFEKIYLLGVDFSYAEKKVEKYAHFYKEDILVSTGYENQVYLAYLSAKMYADEHNIKIYNATRGGKLEVFERVNFDSLFYE